MSGGKGDDQVVGYKYFLGVQMALAHGPLDNVTRIEIDKRIAWEGLNTGGPLEITGAEELFGETEGGVGGTVDIDMGLPTQGQNTYLLSVLGEDLPAFRGVACAVLNQAYVGNNPYIKPWSFRCARIDVTSGGAEQWYVEKASIGTFECDGFECDAYRNFLSANAEHVWPLDDESPGPFVDIVGSINLSVSSQGGTVDYRFADVWGGGACSGELFAHTDNDLGAVAIQTDDQSIFSGLESYILGVVIYPESARWSGQAIQWEGAGGSGQDNYYGVDVSGNLYFWYRYDNDFYQYTSSASVPADSRAHCFAIKVDESANPVTWTMYLDWEEVDSGNVGGPAYTLGSKALFLNFLRGGPGTGGYAFKADANLNISDARDAFLRNFSDYEATDGCSACSDMNPAHIVYECLTDATWGMGYNAADIDEAAFEAAADTLYAEGMGISILWDRETEIQDFVTTILSHIDAVLYVSRTTGQFVLKLIRDDYSDSNLVILDESSVVSVSDARRPTVGELTSSVTVNFWDKETGEQGSVTEHNWPLIQLQGAQTHTTLQYPGFTNYENAQRAALRDLTQLSTPLLSCTVECNREGAELNIGDAFVLDWPDLDIDSLVMRVAKMSLGDGRQNTVVIEATEDIYYTPPTLTAAAPEDGLWVDPSTLEPDFAAPRVVTEAPYYELVRINTQLNTDNIIANNNDVGYLLVAAGRQGNELNADINIDAGSGYSGGTQLDFAPYAFIVPPVGFADTEIFITGGVDLDEVETPSIAQIGDELIRVDEIRTDSTGAQYVVCGRGILDTVPHEHGADSTGFDSNNVSRSDAIVFWGGDAYGDKVEYTASESLDVKLRTRQGSSTLPLDQAPVDTVTFNSRAFRPYPAGNLAIDGESYPEPNTTTEIYYSADHVITWAYRDRLQQTDGNFYDYTAGNIGPEDGTTYTVNLKAILQDGTETAPFWTEDVGQTTSYTMDSVGGDDSSRGVPPPDTERIKVEVVSYRDGYQGWQAPYAYLSYLSDSVGDSIGAGIDSIGSANSIGVFDSVGDSNNADPYWDNVAYLHNFEDGLATDAKGNSWLSDGTPTLETTTVKWGSKAVAATGTSNLYTSASVTAAGTGDFCWEGWVYSISSTGNRFIIDTRSAGATNNWALYSLNPTNTWRFLSGGVDLFTFSNDLTGAWHYIKVYRESGTTYVDIDGVNQGSAVDSTSYASTQHHLGDYRAATNTTNAYHDDVRYTVGVSRSADGVPTAPFPTQ